MEPLIFFYAMMKNMRSTLNYDFSLLFNIAGIEKNACAIKIPVGKSGGNLLSVLPYQFIENMKNKISLMHFISIENRPYV